MIIVGDCVVLWEVFDYDDEGAEVTVARFKDPQKAAMYTLNNKHAGCEMMLHKLAWNTKTED